jgi:hypothetical protein
MSQEQSKRMDDGGGLAANETISTTIRKRVFYLTFALNIGNRSDMSDCPQLLPYTTRQLRRDYRTSSCS